MRRDGCIAPRRPVPIDGHWADKALDGGGERRHSVTMRVFVSYSREDRAHVDRIVADLTNLGHDVWFDQQLLGGTDWWAEILRRIEGAHVFLFALSPTSVASMACLTELQYANDTRRRLLPVMVRWTSPVALPASLAHAQFVDYANVGWTGLSAALVKMPPPPPLPDPLPPAPSLPEPPLARLRRIVVGPEPMSRGAQHEMIDDVVRLGQHADQAAAYDVLQLLVNRPDLFADVDGRAQSALEELWSRVPSDERETRTSPWVKTPRWSWGYVIGMCALSFVTFGLVPLILGVRNRDRPLRRVQAWVMIVVAIGYLVFLIAIMITSAGTETQ